MSFLLCTRIKSKKRKFGEKKSNEKLPALETVTKAPDVIRSPENSIPTPDVISPVEQDKKNYTANISSNLPQDNFQTDNTIDSRSCPLIDAEDLTERNPTKDTHSTSSAMAGQQETIRKLQQENDSLRRELREVKNSCGSKQMELEITQLKTEVESLRAQNSALQKGLKDMGITAKVIGDREERLRCEEERLVSEREMVQRQIKDCYAKMRPILEREASRQEEVDDLRSKLSMQTRSSRRIFDLMERLMIEWKQNVLLRSEVKKLKTLILSSSRSLNNITRTMDDREYKARGAIKTEVSKVVKVTYDSKREVIQYQQIINDALDTMLAIRELQKSGPSAISESSKDDPLSMQKIKGDHTDVAAVIGQSWRKVGRNLGFSVEQLQLFEERHGHQGQEEIAWKIMEKWTEEADDESLLLGTFITALRDAEIDTSIGPMPEDDMAVLQRLNTYMHEAISNINGVLPFMYGFGLLTNTMKRFIENGETEGERVRRLLSIVPTLGEHTLPIFSEILRLGGHDQVAERICKEQLLVRLERSGQDTSDKALPFIDSHLPEVSSQGEEKTEDGNGNKAAVASIS